MSIDSTWLRCPNCFADLSALEERVYGCERGHRFDRSKHGYLTLLPPKAPRTLGDDRAMLADRAALLESGAYRPIADALTDAVLPRATESEAADLRVADLGCGTGYYAGRVSQTLHDARLLLADRSPDAMRRAVRAIPDGTGVVLDLWRPLPLRDDSADVVLNVFAPRNPAEFARILRPGGRLLVVVPRAAHLHELRRRGALLAVPPRKVTAVTEQLDSAGLVRTRSRAVEYLLSADESTRALLIGMGPTARHTAARRDDHGTGTMDVTVAVDVLTFVHQRAGRPEVPAA
ncbi:putative RNA methyltransferase [Agromyces sp. Marseille-P2726]|uniref:putative RNA methyltransferase n=1 Tax=Agromyces sp. Marseille-P2726 TaxID=2709132 RepID=UPI00156FB42A|nr:methyltransferase domain-containing protein [Agromyces sp. Marseille-P2726]